jgi:DNA-binding NarL/FixJ family response regulator
MTTKVLLIGHGMFHDGLKRLLTEQSQMSVVGTANTWDEARAMLAQLQPDVLIVEQEAADLYEDNLASLLDMQDHAKKIIYLTLAESKMVIHDRQQVEGATIDHLVKALQVNTAIP